ncbi:MAG: chorismate mutase [Methanobacteriota archaeon]|uniref:Chorismate mutase n=1 Tax=Halorutilus salinus TaxID=2487751 RepID=A0A9Q4C3J3_9EURY|nr:chorismate mutase [Halorutilus salinus]MCX2818447.1 chorismate mutase [Halorutilus salinus]
MEETRRKGSETRNGQQGSLDELREEIEEIDNGIVESIARRTYVAESIARVKEERGMGIHDPDREEEVLERVEERAESLEVDPETVREVFELLMGMSKDEQRRHTDTD